MSFLDYLKEKWLTYVFILLSYGFAIAVYQLDTKFTVSYSNATYIMIGLLILLIMFILLDYILLNLRVKRLMAYVALNASSDEDLDSFAYPLDRQYAEGFNHVVNKFEEYKVDIRNQSAEELEFITKWVHDIKVPISSLKLIMESHDSHLEQSFYEKIDTEIAIIEQAAQTVFYHIKANTFHDDYKIGEVSTKKMIADALKKYANFFSYKRMGITISGENHKVLTDEKWSEYIISQIISNAVKYTPVEGSIMIDTRKNGSEISIVIRNTGKGILSKDMGQIFNKGYTSSEDRKGMKATGYGLYLARKLSDKMGHELTVSSEYGEYAEFQLTFLEQETTYQVTKM